MWENLVESCQIASGISDGQRTENCFCWKLGRSRDKKLFDREVKKDSSEFVVFVLIDASGSQRSRQSHVALQAFMISEALTNVGIPHRVMSFCTFWDYTVMRRFREYEDGREANLRIFEFYGSSNNRDGLALAAAGVDLLKRREDHKIVIVFSDGLPNDMVSGRKRSGKPEKYIGEAAIRDTCAQVRKLRREGVLTFHKNHFHLLREVGEEV